MKTIGGVLGRSPFGPLHEHMMKVNDCSKMLRPLMEHFLKEDCRKVSDGSKPVSRLEHEADNIQFDFAKKLFEVKTELTPVSVSPLMNISREVGAIADHAENVADCLSRIIVGR
jgi:uncharacterized protein Yka (UPF0111/DUF47 family)